MTNFKVGDKVQVVHPSNTYTTFAKMFEKLQFRNHTKNMEFEKGTIATVFAVAEHPNSSLPLLALETLNGDQCLIAHYAVVKIDTEISAEDKFDIIRQFCDEVLSFQVIEDKVIFKYLLQKCCK